MSRPRAREVSEAAAADLARAGGRDAPVELVDHDPAWAARFAAESERLAPLLGGAEVHHIGSTAVPGLAAKPVIDLMALVDDVDAPVAALVERGGYAFPEASTPRWTAGAGCADPAPPTARTTCIW